MRQALLNTLKWYCYRWKYERFSLLWSIMFFPITYFISLYLRGEFIKTVTYAGIRLPYIKFLVISWAMAWMVRAVFNSVSRSNLEIDKIRMIEDSIFIHTISNFLSSFIWESSRFLSIYIPIMIIFGFSLREIILISTSLPILSIQTFFFSLFISSFGFILRSRDFLALRWLCGNIISVVIPIIYSVFQVIPKDCIFILYVFPQSLSFEFFRELILTGNSNLWMLVESFLFTTPWIPLSIFTFKFLFDVARRRGLISLR